ncbi:MAG: Holliday junction resolvase Hjc [Candidatus Bathyarchaeota archaeon]|nr:Holliday junction resolvase Hjc [Candidatus Bathyarchaeota archaeon]
MSLRDLAARSKHKYKGRRGRILTLKEIKRMKKRGYQAERDLVRRLRELGFKSVRIPVSAPSSEPLPDVFATKGECVIAFEVKAPNADRAYFPEDQVKKLFSFLEMFEAYPFKLAILAAKFPYKWVFKKINSVNDYSINKDEESNITFEAIC